MAFVKSLTAKGKPLCPTDRAILTESLEAFRTTIGQADRPELQLERARSYCWLGIVTLRFGPLSQAEHDLTRAATIRKFFEVEQGRDPNQCAELGVFWIELSKVLVLQGRFAQAEKLTRRALRSLKSPLPTNLKERNNFHLRRAFAQHQLGHLLLFQGKENEATQHFVAATDAIWQVRTKEGAYSLGRMHRTIDEHLEQLSFSLDQ